MIYLKLGPLSWKAYCRSGARPGPRRPHSFYTGGVYWRGKIVWTLTWWGL